MVGILISLLRFLVQVEPVVPLEQDVDPVLVWLQRLSVGSAVVGILLVLFLIVAQRRLSEGLLKWLCAGALVLLPLLVIAMGNIIGLQHAKKVEFCQSCHLTMGHFIKDMLDPGSQTLAAQHYRNRWSPDDQCYACHTSYGLFGDVQAKRKGVADFFKYYTRTFTIPVRMEIPYANAGCLKCHERTPKFLDSETHRGSLVEIRSGDLRCIDCHGPAHPEQVTP
jgi:cytochrome c nitrite reductase small subunit